MKKRKVRLEIWATLDGETGYVWSKITSKRPRFDVKLNAPYRPIRFLSEPYESSLHPGSASFGTEVSAEENMSWRELALKQREALKECGRFGYWGRNTSSSTLIETLDYITDTARVALALQLPKDNE